MSEEERKQKARERSKKYYQKNKDKILAKQKEYVRKKYHTDEEFRKKTLERSRKYAKNNIEKVRELKRNWARNHYKELREKGLLPPSKKEIIENQQQEIKRLTDELSIYKEATAKLRDVRGNQNIYGEKLFKDSINWILEALDEDKIILEYKRFKEND